MHIKKYMKTAQISMRTYTNGGILYMFPQILLKILALLPLMFIWRSLLQSGVESEMSLPQLLSYTFVNSLLGDLLIVKTYMTDWDFNSKSTALFTRPAPVFGQVISRTAGEWLPSLLMYSLPMALIAPLLGIDILPRTLWFFPSLFLCVSLGFAMEFVFFCITLRLRNVSWLTQVIRSAIVSIFSGVIIPFRILPFGMERWMAFQPFGSLGGASLSLFVGSAQPGPIITAQIIWTIVFWLSAAIWFKKSRERMVSFGG